MPRSTNLHHKSAPNLPHVSFHPRWHTSTCLGLRLALCVSAPLSHTALPAPRSSCSQEQQLSKRNPSAAQGAPGPSPHHTPCLELLAPQAVPCVALACWRRTASYVSTCPLNSISSSRSSQQVDARTTICDARPPRDYGLNGSWLGDPIGRQGLVLLVARIGDHGRNRRRSAAAESFGLLRQLVCLPASPASSLAYYLV